MAYPFKFRPRFIINCGVYISIFIMLLLCVATTWLLFSSAAPKWVVAKLNQFTAVQISVSGYEGRLARSLVLRDIVYVAPALSISIETLEVDWQFMHVLRGELFIDKLELRGLDVTVKQNSDSVDKNTSFENLPEINLPVDFKVKNFRLLDLLIQNEEAPLILIDKLETQQINWDSLGLRWHDLSVESARGGASLSGSVNPTERYPVNVSISWYVNANEKQRVEGDLDIAGDVNRLEIFSEINAPVNIKINGEIDQPLDFDKSAWKASLLGEWNAQDINVSWPSLTTKIDLSLSGTMERYLAKGKAQVSGRGLPSLIASATVEGDGDRVFISKLEVQDETSRVQVLLTGEYAIKDGAFDVKAHWQNFHYLLGEDNFLISDKGSASAKGYLADYVLSMDALFVEKNIGEMQVEVMGRGDTKGIFFECMHMKTMGGEVTGRGLVEWREDLGVRGQLSWQNLNWLANEYDLNLAGSLQLDYKNSQYNFDGAVSVNSTQLPNSQWQFEGKGDAKSVELSRLQGKSLAGLIEGDLWVGVFNEPQWQWRLNFKGINPGVHWEKFQGDLNAEAIGRGQLAQHGTVTEVEILNINGILKSKPVYSSAFISMKGKNIDAASLALSWGHASLNLAGRWAEDVNLAWDFAIPDVGPILENAAGSLYSQGRVHGMRAAPALTATLDGEALRWQGQTVDRINASIEWDGENLHSRMQWDNARIYGVDVEKVLLSAKGPLSLHTADLTVTANNETLFGLAVQGRWHEGAWQGELERLSVNAEHWGRWRLAEKSDITASRSTLMLDKLCLASDEGASVCSRVRYLHGQWMVETTANNFPVTNLSRYVESELDFVGVSDFELLASNQGDELSVKLSALAPDSQLQLKQLSNNYLQLNDTRFDMELNSSGLRAELRSGLGQSDGLALSVFFPGMGRHTLDWPNQHAEGRLRLNVENIAWLKPFIPEVEELAGRLSTELRFEGAMSAPRLEGEMHLTGGEAGIPRAGLKLEKIAMQAKAKNDGYVDFLLTAESAGGSLNVEGRSLLDKNTGWPTTLRLVGKDFEIVRIPEVHMIITPELEIISKNKTIEVTGEIFVPRAKLQPKDMSMAVKVSEDMDIVGLDRNVEKKTDWRISSKVKLLLGDRVKFYGYGLEANISGAVLLVDKPGHLTTAKGELVISDGRYRAYGQRLKIENGKILFTGGPVGNPGLDIRAVREIDDVAAGVKVRGTMLSPRLVLFTQPAMGQADALSYLVLGRPIDAASTQEDGAVLLNAAVALGLSGGDTLARQIGDRFGFDEMRVDTNESGEASLIVGRYLMPKLYISYGIGLLEAMDTVKLRYELGRHWRLTAEKRGDHQGSDLIYTIER